MDIVQLGFDVNSRPLVQGKDALDRFGRAGRDAGEDIGRMGAASRRGLGLAAAAATAAVGAIASLGATIGTISEFDSSMSRLGAVTRASAGDLMDMRDIAQDLGSTTEFSAMQAADGLTFLGMAGFTASESMAAVADVLDLATASGLGLAQSADIASNIMSGFGIAAENAANVTDILAAASSRANTDVGQLGDAMSTVAPISAALGIGLADTAAAIGVLSDAGIQGARAGTAMRAVLASLAGPTAEAETTLKALGLTIADVNPETNALSDIMGRLGEAGLTTAQAMTIFGREAVSGALVLVEGTQRLSEFGDELRNVDGAAGDMAETMRDNLGGDIQGLQSAVSGLALALGDAGLTAILRGVVAGLTGITRAVTLVVDGFGGFFGVIGGLITGTDQARVATDNLTLAMGDEIGQAQKLLAAIEPGRVLSEDLAGVKLAQARAHLAAADAQRQESIELAKASTEYQRQQDIINNNREILQQYQDLQAQGEVAGQFEADQIKLLNEQLREAVAAQEALVDAAASTPEHYEEIQSEILRIEDAISKAVDGVVVLDGAVITAVELTERLAFTAESINFSTAISGAGVLANSIAGAAAQARVLVANLGLVPTALAGLATDVVSQVDALRVANASLTDQITNGTDSRVAAIRAERNAILNQMEIEGVSLTVQQDRIAAMDREIATLEMLAGENTALTTSLQDVTTAAAGNSAATGAASRSTAKLSEEAKKAAQTLKTLRDALDDALNDARTPLQEFNDGLSELNELAEFAASQGVDFGNAYAQGVSELNDGLADSIPLVGDVSDAFSDWLGRGLSDFNSFASDIFDGFKNLLIQMAQTALQNRILIPLVTGGTGLAGTAANAAGSLGGGGVTGGLLSGLGAGFSSGLGSVGSGLLSGGLSGGLSASLGGITSGVAAGGLAGFGAALGAAVPLIGAAALAVSFFSSRTKTLDEGLQLTADAAGIAVDEFERVRRTRFFGLSSSTRESLDAASEEIAGPIEEAYGRLIDGVTQAAGALGIGADAFADFSTSIRVSTDGLSDAEANAAINAALIDASNELANQALRDLEATSREPIDLSLADLFDFTVPSDLSEVDLSGLKDQVSSLLSGVNFFLADAFNLPSNLIQEGEDATQALDRLSSSMTLVNAVFDELAGVTVEVTAATSQVSSEIITAAGGLEAFAAAANSYYDLFFTDAEKLDALQDDVAATLAEFGISQVPATIEEYRATVDGLIQDGYREAAAGLISLSPIFAEMVSIQEQMLAVSEAAAESIRAERDGIQQEIDRFLGDTEAIRARELAALDPSNVALQERLFALEDARAAEEALAAATAETTAEIEAAVNALSENDFASLFDFQRAAALTLQGLPAANSVSTNGAITPATEPTEAAATTNSIVTQLEMINQRLQDQEKMTLQYRMKDLQQGKKATDTLVKWDKTGLPLERAS